MVIQTKAILAVVTFIARYYFKATGSIVYQVRSENNEEYCVTLNTNGTTGCYNRETGEECQGHKYAHKSGHDCHHVIDCQLQEEKRTEQMAAIRAQDVAEIEAAWVAGLASGACNSRKPCYHMTQLEAKETEHVQSDEPYLCPMDTIEMHPDDIAINAEIAAWDRDELSFDNLSDAAQEIAAEIGEHAVQCQQAEYEEYSAWKVEMGLDMPLTEEQVEAICTYELAVL